MILGVRFADSKEVLLRRGGKGALTSMNWDAGGFRLAFGSGGGGLLAVLLRTSARSLQRSRGDQEVSAHIRRRFASDFDIASNSAALSRRLEQRPPRRVQVKQYFPLLGAAHKTLRPAHAHAPHAGMESRDAVQGGGRIDKDRPAGPLTALSPALVSITSSPPS